MPERLPANAKTRGELSLFAHRVLALSPLFIPVAGFLVDEML
jgi:hypothetical protein